MAASWREFADDAPTIAEAVTTIFDRYEVVLIGTISPDSRPRLSLVETRIVDEQLVIGTLDDAKAVDLTRDPRCSLHSLVGHRTHEDAVFKADAVAAEVVDGGLTTLVAILSRPEIRWRPERVFELRLVRATVTTNGTTARWRHP